MQGLQIRAQHLQGDLGIARAVHMHAHHAILAVLHAQRALGFGKLSAHDVQRFGEMVFLKNSIFHVCFTSVCIRLPSGAGTQKPPLFAMAKTP